MKPLIKRTLIFTNRWKKWRITCLLAAMEKTSGTTCWKCNPCPPLPPGPLTGPKCWETAVAFWSCDRWLAVALSEISWSKVSIGSFLVPAGYCAESELYVKCLHRDAYMRTLHVIGQPPRGCIYAYSRQEVVKYPLYFLCGALWSLSGTHQVFSAYVHHSADQVQYIWHRNSHWSWELLPV